MAKNYMFGFHKNMRNLLPKVSLPYSTTRGTFAQRQDKAIKLVDKLYRDLSPKFGKRGYITFEDLIKSVNDVLEKKINVSIKKCTDPEFDGSSDIIYSPITGNITGTTLEFFSNNKKIKLKDLITILHEFQHITDQLFHPKYLIRNQQMSKNRKFTYKYNNLYDNYLYAREYPENKKDKIYILKNLRYKIHKFLRKMSTKDKIDYLQDARYTLQMEHQAYSTQLKYAKKMKKKHIPINQYDLIKENPIHMMEEKINLIKEMAFEIIKKERKKHALKLKKCKNNSK